MMTKDEGEMNLDEIIRLLTLLLDREAKNSVASTEIGEGRALLYAIRVLKELSANGHVCIMSSSAPLRTVVVQAVDRLRRSMPRNADVLLVCEVAIANV